ncbi:hypothetical protein FB45DRAFT_1002544 [Roridomyces roridus]|uniref:Arylamine N-acetyltransferase n=1 Tax=Roridomyces roridus TaxID=1738132 RepID=A0AAD7FSM3_9AGAR|nr:hypothetical protein FB45DRAFT_1002544 [Roridomyces roridus]
MASTKGLLRDGLWIKRTQSVYSPAQVGRWLSKIQYPGSVSGFEPNLDNLTHLLQLSAATFPFENTPMHYTPGHSMDISAEGLYERMVGSGGGEGSYCFGLNGLFLQMIRALGFRAYATAGRINRETSWHLDPAFLSVGHMIIFVQPTEGSNETFVLDVGYGPVRPILLEEGAKIMGATPSETYTLLRTARAESSLKPSPDSESGIPAKVEWRLICCHSHKDASQPPISRVMYSFIEDEFFQADFDSFNYSVLGRRQGTFWENVICTKYFWLTEEEMAGAEQYMGKLVMAGDSVRRNIGTTSTVLRTMKTERDRADALAEFFDIRISYENLVHIRGRGPELNGEP